ATGSALLDATWMVNEPRSSVDFECAGCVEVADPSRTGDALLQIVAASRCSRNAFPSIAFRFDPSSQRGASGGTI
ncbi:MAG: hypothetical protein ACYCSN_07935, partial [Acidobacteriaceae bacterium]